MASYIRNAVGVNQAVVPVFPPPFLSQRAPAVSDTLYPVGQIWVNQSLSPAVLYTKVSPPSQTGTGAIWEVGGDALATTTTPGIVYLATTAETASGGAPN